MGLEPTTLGLRVPCSTDCANQTDVLYLLKGLLISGMKLIKQSIHRNSY